MGCRHAAETAGIPERDRDVSEHVQRGYTHTLRHVHHPCTPVRTRYAYPLSVCVPVLEKQLATWDELLRVIPSVLIGNLEHRHEAELRKEVGGVKVELEGALLASEKEKVRRMGHQSHKETTSSQL